MVAIQVSPVDVSPVRREEGTPTGRRGPGAGVVVRTDRLRWSGRAELQVSRSRGGELEGGPRGPRSRPLPVAPAERDSVTEAVARAVAGGGRAAHGSHDLPTECGTA